MTSSSQYRDSFLNQCIHNTGPWDATHCKAGVEFDSVLDKSQRPYRRPCGCPDTQTTCEKRETPTEADYEAWEKALAEDMTRTFLVRAAILATGERAGRIDCPCCDGTVGFTVASNDHVAAACSTEGCVKWVE